MSDEKIEQDAHRDADAAGANPSDVPARPDAAESNIDDRPPQVEGGQPPVGDDLPRNTEF
jgi:hypothetical protein